MLLSSEKQNNERYVFHWKLQVWSKYFPNIASDKYDYASNLIQDFCALELRQQTSVVLSKMKKGALMTNFSRSFGNKYSQISHCFHGF